MPINTNRVDTYKGRLQEGYADVSGNRVYQSNIGTVSTGGTERILEGHAINELYLYPVYKGSGNYRHSDGSLDVNGGPRDGMIRTAEDLTWLRGMVDAGYRFQPADGIDPTKIWYGDLIYAEYQWRRYLTATCMTSNLPANALRLPSITG